MKRGLIIMIIVGVIILLSPAILSDASEDLPPKRIDLLTKQKLLTPEEVLNKYANNKTIQNQSLFEEIKSPKKKVIKKKTTQDKPIVKKTNMIYTGSEFKTLGVIYYIGYKWTWYSERVLPGGGLDIPGRHVDSSGYVCDKDGYICLATNGLSKGTILNTPFGKQGKIYDCGCPIGTIDVYVSW